MEQNKRYFPNSDIEIKQLHTPGSTSRAIEISKELGSRTKIFIHIYDNEIVGSSAWIPETNPKWLNTSLDVRRYASLMDAAAIIAAEFDNYWEIENANPTNPGD